MSDPDTLPKLLVRNAQSAPRDVALREKEFGIWRSITWAEYEARTRAIALGLHKLGLGAGDVIGLIGDNRPDWVMGEIAAHAIGRSACIATRWRTRSPTCWNSPAPRR
jgi:long-chain acyl-CoA synthetase